MKKMKKFLALSAVLALLLTLCACDWFSKIKDNDNTTLAPTSADTTTTDTDTPPDSPSPMEPLQGGPMLYTFPGSGPYKTEISEYDGDEYPVYPLGLVNQGGKLVSPPVYHFVDYIYDEAKAQVIGLSAVKDREITIYELGGQSRVLPCEGYRIDVYPGGRYATIYTSQDFSWTGAESVSDPLREGIFDLQKNKFVVEPKVGQMIQYAAGGVALGYQYNSADATGNETAQWAFKCADESILELPLSMGRVQQYFPETGWFGSITADYEQRVYDKDLKLIPSMTGWSVDFEGFRGGAWCMIYNNHAFPGVSTWVNRAGELSDKRVKGEIYTHFGWQCFLVDGDKLFDADLNEIAAPKSGERLVKLWNMGGADSGGFVLLDSAGNIKAAYDLAAQPMKASARFACWFNDETDGVYASHNGQLFALDLTRFFPTPKPAHKGGIPYARAIAVCADYAVITTGVHWWEAGAAYDTFAVDWQGKPMDDCPLQPFYALLDGRTAGEQGPLYYWVEQEGGQRGYINTSGEWLFIDEG